MEKNLQTVLFASIIFVLLLASALLASGSGIFSMDLLSAGENFPQGILSLINTELILLGILFPLLLGFISALTHSLDRKTIYICTLGGCLPAILISFLLFGLGLVEILFAIFVLVAIVLVVEISFVKSKELKTLVTFRTASSAGKTAFLALAIALFISSAAIGLENNEKNVKELGDKIIDLAVGGGSTNSSLAAASADLLINSQKQAVGSIAKSPQFEKLRSKQDPDVQTFVVAIDSMQAQLDSPHAREQVISEIEKKAPQAKSSINFEFLRKTSPMIDAIATYYWLISAFAITSAFLFFSNLIGSNLAGFFAAVIRKVLEFMHSEAQ
ncbi:MAG TPA: hypothetical protein VJG83_03900 [archaeon]|nr:hypothetical protein [archaeon]